MKRGAWLGLVAAAIFSSGCGWSRNQKEGVKLAATRGFVRGLAKHNKRVDAKTLDAWGTCVADKVAKRWKSFAEFKAHQRDPDNEKFRRECAAQTKLFQAITLKK